MQETQQATKKISKAINLLEEVTNDQANQIQTSVMETLSNSKERATQALQDFSSSTQKQARMIDSKVRENPWRSIGIGAAAGAVLGFVLGRNK